MNWDWDGFAEAPFIPHFLWTTSAPEMNDYFISYLQLYWFLYQQIFLFYLSKFIFYKYTLKRKNYFKYTLSGKKIGNQLNISGLYVLGSMLNMIFSYKTAIKYPENPCNTQFCSTWKVLVSYLELSTASKKNTKRVKKN